jgi:hypothetical protein
VEGFNIVREPLWGSALLRDEVGVDIGVDIEVNVGVNSVVDMLVNVAFDAGVNTCLEVEVGVCSSCQFGSWLCIEAVFLFMFISCDSLVAITHD